MVVKQLQRNGISQAETAKKSHTVISKNKCSIVARTIASNIEREPFLNNKNNLIDGDSTQKLSRLSLNFKSHSHVPLRNSNRIWLYHRQVYLFFL